MKASLLMASALAAMLAFGAASARADDDEVLIPPYIDPALAKQAKVPVADAEKIVLRVHPGKVVDESIVVENGILRWILKVKGADGNRYETDVDAKTGKVLEDARGG